MLLFSKHRKAERSKSRFYDIGFHGDKYLLTLVDTVADLSSTFIETGTNVGSTLTYFASKYKHIHCLSCEVDKKAFREASNNASGLTNVQIYNLTSQKFMKHLYKKHKSLFEKNVLFWLDAHGFGFRWPLREEISFITKNFRSPYILIDDFKVPNLENFGFDEYAGQICSFDHIENALNQGFEYNVYYPCYHERTSKHHPLRGWVLIEYGHKAALKLPPLLRDNIEYHSVAK